MRVYYDAQTKFIGIPFGRTNLFGSGLTGGEIARADLWTRGVTGTTGAAYPMFDGEYRITNTGQGGTANVQLAAIVFDLQFPFRYFAIEGMTVTGSGSSLADWTNLDERVSASTTNWHTGATYDDAFAFAVPVNGAAVRSYEGITTGADTNTTNVWSTGSRTDPIDTNNTQTKFGFQFYGAGSEFYTIDAGVLWLSPSDNRPRSPLGLSRDTPATSYADLTASTTSGLRYYRPRAGAELMKVYWDAATGFVGIPLGTTDILGSGVTGAELNRTDLYTRGPTGATTSAFPTFDASHRILNTGQTGGTANLQLAAIVFDLNLPFRYFAVESLSVTGSGSSVTDWTQIDGSTSASPTNWHSAPTFDDTFAFAVPVNGAGVRSYESHPPGQVNTTHTWSTGTKASPIDTNNTQPKFGFQFYGGQVEFYAVNSGIVWVKP